MLQGFIFYENVYNLDLERGKVLGVETPFQILILTSLWYRIIFHLSMEPWTAAKKTFS